MWKKVGYQPVGGLREIGFIENVEVYHYKITRGYGFSKTGKSFITAHAHGINFWARNE